MTITKTKKKNSTDRTGTRTSTKDGRRMTLLYGPSGGNRQTRQRNKQIIYCDGVDNKCGGGGGREA